MKNPFYQPPHQWQVRIFVDRDIVPAVSEAFEDLALAVSSFEIEEDGEKWCVDVLTDQSPEASNIAARMALMAGMIGISTPHFETKKIEPKDWVSEVERSFAPLHVGRFYVHGSHVAAAPPVDKIPLRVNAGAAFGSGEHATTSGCLLALSQLAKRRRFLRPLDMGCGSGILAIAMAKLWQCQVLGVDVDPVSVRVARENSRRNHTHKLTHFAAADGYHAASVRAHAPFDLIVTNILARPLVRMAPMLAKYLASDGVVVLSGLLVSQERMVLAAHRAQGLVLHSAIRQNGWSALVLKA
jgi:ribosomal protein L11 methyltransferase